MKRRKTLESERFKQSNRRRKATNRQGIAEASVHISESESDADDEADNRFEGELSNLFRMVLFCVFCFVYVERWEVALFLTSCNVSNISRNL